VIENAINIRSVMPCGRTNAAVFSILDNRSQMSGKEESIADVDGRDRRVKRTRAALLKAFTELLLDQGYESMTVAEVAERADVGRSTLYEHFRTKEDLLKASLGRPWKTLAACASPCVELQKVVALLRHFRENSAISRRLLTQPMRSRIAHVLAELIADHLQKEGELAALPVPLAAAAIAEGQLALVDLWLREYPSVEAETVARSLVKAARAFSVSLDLSTS
jgi:AcrR family transcriptional regulator